MVSESFDLSITDPTMVKTRRKDTYQMKKSIVWTILSLIIAIFIILFVLTVYFGLNRKRIINERNSLIKPTNYPIDPPILSPPVERVPMSLKQEIYRLIISPNLTSETFQGILYYTFTCVESTDEVILHLKDLLIDNSSIKIISSSLPIYKSLFYDSYSELIKLKFSSSFIPKTQYTLHLIYSANISHELHGLYISRYTDVNGMNKTFMTSQMEPTHARTVFPCIDEPARKAKFYISVIHDREERVWSNGEIERMEVMNDGRVVSHFTPTLTMSTFLLALIVAPKADFDCRPDRILPPTNIKSRICGRVDILPQLAYADEIAYKSLQFFNDYFGMIYPLPKIEHFAVPDFGAGAMENYGRVFFFFHWIFCILLFLGLVIYREVGLFFDEKTVSASRKQYINKVVAHEIAHQWFGNLVSPAWWGEL
jgi:aminopeptidase N